MYIKPVCVSVCVCKSHLRLLSTGMQKVAKGINHEKEFTEDYVTIFEEFGS